MDDSSKLTPAAGRNDKTESAAAAVDDNQSETTEMASWLSPKSSLSCGMSLLPRDYVPGEYDVICGRGSTCFRHEGNIRFRKIVEEHVERYKTAPSKLDKTLTVRSIMEIVKDSTGLFIRKDFLHDRWCVVTDHLAKEKIGHTLRDAIKCATNSCWKNKKKTTVTLDNKTKNHDKARRQQVVEKDDLEAAPRDDDILDQCRDYHLLLRNTILGGGDVVPSSRLLMVAAAAATIARRATPLPPSGIPPAVLEEAWNRFRFLEAAAQRM